MRVLIDLQHPAHLHFFRPLIGLLEEAGHQIYVTGRDKDILRALASSYGLQIDIFGGARPGLLWLSGELLSRQAKLLQRMRQFRPDVVLAVGGTFVSLIGKLLGIPTYVFYDTEDATLSNLLAYPFATCVYVPSCYSKSIPWTHQRYAGYHELAYLHPRYFRPDSNVPKKYGLGEKEPYTVIRLVSWGAAHDLGQRGLDAESQVRLVETCNRHGDVVLSSEGPLAPELERLRFQSDPADMHHLLAFASLVAGESATMMSEAAVLGVPGVYVSSRSLGYVDELAERYGIVFRFSPTEHDRAIEKAGQLLEEKRRDVFQEARARMLEEKIDVTSMLHDLVLTLDASKRRDAVGTTDPAHEG